MADATAIFLDTQVFDAASFNFKTTVLVSLAEQVQRGTVRLVLTDIAIREVKARIEKTVRSQFELLKKFRRDARVLRSSSVPGVKVAMELDEMDVIADLHQQFDEFLERTNSEVIDTSAVPAGPVFDKYFANQAPFGSGDKKAEFPDAFAIEALAEWTNRNRQGLYVVSGDEPMRAACHGHKRLHPEQRLSGLLDRIVLEAAVASFLREQIMLRIDPSQGIGEGAIRGSYV